MSKLERKCENWFRERHGSRPWFAGKGVAPPDTTDIVLCGDFLGSLATATGWPAAPRRLWALGTRARDAAAALLGLSPGAIGIVPRDELFTPARKPRALPVAAQPWTLVLDPLADAAERAFARRVVASLQENFSPPVKLLVANVAAAARLSTPCPVYASFARHRGVDFGLGAALARQEGWPCVLSDWGGHVDVEGPGVYKIPVISFGGAFETEHTLAGRAFAIARDLDQWLRTELKSQSTALAPARPARTLASKRIHAARARAQARLKKPTATEAFEQSFAAALPRSCQQLTLVLASAGGSAPLESAWVSVASGTKRVVHCLRLPLKAAYQGY